MSDRVFQITTPEKTKILMDFLNLSVSRKYIKLYELYVVHVFRRVVTTVRDLTGSEVTTSSVSVCLSFSA